MPATITLTTMPGSIERHDAHSTLSVEVSGPSFGCEDVAVASVEDVRAAVRHFGERVRAAHPHASFLICITVREGDRKPRGFDAARRGNGFGQQDHMHVVDKRNAAARAVDAMAGAAAFIPVAAWGGPGTPFHLAGRGPIEREPADTRLWDYAGGHLGFYGYLRVADTRISRRVGVGLLGLADRRWRDAYDGRVHPSEAADGAIAEEAEEMGVEEPGR